MDSDYPDDVLQGENHEEEESTYPDIDENVHYPWQNDQSFDFGNMLASVIDPRLFGDQHTQQPQSINQYPPEVKAQAEAEAEAEYASSDGYENQVYPPVSYPPVPGAGASSDEEFVLSGEDESVSEDDEDAPAEEDDDNSSGASRRRRRGGGRFSGRYGARGGKGIKRGPRKPLEPSSEFKLLHSEATSAFIDGQFDRAIELVMQAIQINPEMFAAHSLLSEIFLAQNEKDKALAALFNGAHTRPKDRGVWLQVATLILDRAQDNRESALHDVAYCYSRILEVNPGDFNIRFQRAAIYRQLGHNGRAAVEYERILKDCPHSAKALRHLAETYIDLGEVQKAVDHYSDSIDHYLSLEPKDSGFSWSDINIYAELFGYLNQPEEGLHNMKLLARWLLGRGDDTMWEDFEDDDREWDADDSPRRIKTEGFETDEDKKWPHDSYGLGLPLEIRIKMGIFRLKMGDKYHNEAVHHFEWLNPEDDSEGARIFDYGDLFREVADALKQAGLFEEALRYYSPIQQTTEHADIGFFMAMADCCMKLGKVEDAESCYLLVAEHDPIHMESRVLLAKLYESLQMRDQAMKYASEAVLIGRQENRNRRKRKDTRLEQLAIEFKMAESENLRPLAPKPPSAATLMSAVQSGRVQPGEGTRTEDIQFLYIKLLELQPQMREGAIDATEDWLDIADALLRDFRTNRAFYPMARSILFMGYTTGAKAKGAKSKSGVMMDEMQEMAGRLQDTIGEVREEPLHGIIPTDYHGIPFDEWLDIFLQYALVVAEQGEPEEAYETLDSAALASIWLHSKPKSRMIHVCWFSCALRAKDEETLANEARWFIKEYQFVTDTYRLFSMLSLLTGDPHRSLFHSSPNMKFMLRQIKAMDFTIPHSDPRSVRSSVWKERATLSTRDEEGEPIPAEELDIALLVLYGHILYSGNSFYPALNYFFRAYALDDQNPAVLLSIALSYIHHSLKRQCENRHYLIMQGLSFMDEYRRVREKPGSLLSEKQEMEFNFARVYHSLGLAHLAVEGYERALKLGEQIQLETQQKSLNEPALATEGTDVVMGEADQESSSPAVHPLVEDFSREAAYALQCIHVLSGDAKTAKAVTEKWLII